MGKLINRLFGGESALKEISGLTDKYIFTQQEKADVMLKFLNAYEPFRLAQRLIAVPLMYVFLFMVLVAFFVFGYGAVMGDANIASSGKDMMVMIKDVMGIPVALILGFYFAGGTINSYMKKYANKK